MSGGTAQSPVCVGGNTSFNLKQWLHQVFGLLPVYYEQLTWVSICFHGNSLPWHSAGQLVSWRSGQVGINLSSHEDGSWWGCCRREVTTDKVIVSVRLGDHTPLRCQASAVTPSEAHQEGSYPNEHCPTQCVISCHIQIKSLWDQYIFYRGLTFQSLLFVPTFQFMLWKRLYFS